MNKKMHIVFPRAETFNFHGAMDGGSKYIYYLSRELVKRGCEVTVITTFLEEDKKVQERFDEGVKYIFLPPRYYNRKRIFNLPWKLAFSRNIAKFLKNYNFDILHSAEAFAYNYLHFKERKPVIYQCWAMEAWSEKGPKKDKIIHKIYQRYILRRLWQYVITHSDSVAADAQFQIPRITCLGVPRNKIFFIPNGINFYEIQKMKKKMKDMKKPLGVSKKDFLILSVCQIAPGKGIEDIIEGFLQLRRTVNNAKILFVGKGILEAEMRDIFKKNSLIEEKDFFHRKNVPEKELYNYLFSADVFVSAVLSEDFMISIQEAMAAGLPIISSSQPFLVLDGINGYVVGFNNPKGISEGLLKVCLSGEENRKRMGKKSILFAKKYDYSNIAKECMKEYSKLIRLKG